MTVVSFAANVPTFSVSIESFSNERKVTLPSARRILATGHLGLATVHFG
jgi:hypothetical protein